MAANPETEASESSQIVIHPLRGLREALFLLFLAAAGWCFLALLSFDPGDPGWSHSGSGKPIANAGGVRGAWVADFLFSFLGAGAYLFPVLFLIQGWRFFRGAAAGGLMESVLLRWLALVALLTSSSGIAEAIRLPFEVHLPVVGGGILGGEVFEQLDRQFSHKGAGIFLTATWLAAFTLFTDLSWFAMMEAVGRALLWPMRWHARRRSVPPAEAVGNGAAQAGAAPVGAMQMSPLPGAGAEQRRPRAPAVLPEGLMRLGPEPAAAAPAPADAEPPWDEPEAEAAEAEPQAAQGLGFRATPAAAVPAPRLATRSHAPVALPPLDLLRAPPGRSQGYSPEALEQMSRRVEEILGDFNVEVEVVDALPGPVITRFELEPAPGLKASRVSGLATDLARTLRVRSVRVVEVIPGKSVIGLEIPNEQREIIALRELLASELYRQAPSPLTLVLGKDIQGRPVIANLGKMPHLLVAGTTGSGKSVAINAMIMSLVYKASPDQVRLIMIDPKMLELSVYESIPHLLTPVVTNMKEAANALRWCVAEMERRYQLMARLGVRNLDGYNHKVREAIERGQPLGVPLPPEKMVAADGSHQMLLEPLPYIVIIVDELADLMMIVGKKVEEPIARIAQKARAAGLHLILATQRPSVDVLTGLIKANIPTRVAFQVSSRIDSRTILDQGGAEALLGYGDMLYLPPGAGVPLRAHGAFVDDDEVHRVVEFLRASGPAQYLDEITRFSGESSEMGSIFSGEGGEDLDPLYDEAVRFVTESRRASISGVQRKFKIGYNRAARIVEEMEKQGVVGPAETNGSREVLAPPPPEL